MSEMRAIDVADYAPVKIPESFGAAPQLQWLKIADLVVDESYQREITEEGRAKVRKIAAGFNWRYFTPVSAAPVVGGKYALIDGQHRTSGALLAGHEMVPAVVNLADTREQALAFNMINGNVTLMRPAQRFRALVAAGDAEAVALDAMIARAGVRVRMSAGGNQSKFAKPNDSFAFHSIQRAAQKFGEAPTEMALRCILASAAGRPGFLRAAAISALSEMLRDFADWLESPRLLEVFGDFNIDLAARAAEGEAHARPGVAARDILRKKLVAHLTRTLSAPRGDAGEPAPEVRTEEAEIGAKVAAFAAVAPRPPQAIPCSKGEAAKPKSPAGAPRTFVIPDNFSFAGLSRTEMLLALDLLGAAEISTAAIQAAHRLASPGEAGALVTSLRQKIGKFGIAILAGAGGYRIDLPAKTRLRAALRNAGIEIAA